MAALEQSITKKSIWFNILWRYFLHFFSLMYRVTHKGWDCKDDQKLLKYDNFKIKLNLQLRIIISLRKQTVYSFWARDLKASAWAVIP